jgi:hypothetical protein
MAGKPEENEEYSQLLLLERLESLREELEEVGLGTLPEVENKLLTNNLPADLRAMLQEIREEMLELEVGSLEEIESEIDEMHTDLDREEF